jgi:hypothetical protein
MKTFLHAWQYLAEFFLKQEMLQMKVLERINTHILCWLNFFPENRAVCELMWKN